MQKNKILYKLFAIFAGILFCFIFAVDCLFFLLFSNQALSLRQNELLSKVEELTSTLPAIIPQAPKEGGKCRLCSYIDLLQKSNDCHIWLVRPNGKLASCYDEKEAKAFQNFAAANKDFIDKALKGKALTQREFTSNGLPPLTVAAPIYDKSKNLFGTIILYSENTGLFSSVLASIKLLAFCSFLAFLIALTAAWLLSYSFTDPLRRLKAMAIAISEGNYLVRSDIKRNDEFGELAQSIDCMAARLEKAAQKKLDKDRARRLFAANLSHELRTPVAVLRASLEALQSGIIAEDEKEAYLKQMLDETLYLERLVNDTLELAKLQNPDFPIEKAPLLLNDLFSDASRALRQYAFAKDVRIKAQNLNTPAPFCGDYGRLRQMLITVLDNAIKFSPPKSIVELTFLEYPSYYELKICDQGGGIDEKILPKLFSSFHKGNGQKNKSGTGLGLFIARKIAERHDILIQVSNTAGKGACFCFQFSKKNIPCPPPEMVTSRKK